MIVTAGLETFYWYINSVFHRFLTRLTFGNLKLGECLLPLKTEIYRTIILTIVLYGSMRVVRGD
jgi:hypothetical protein